MTVCSAPDATSPPSIDQEVPSVFHPVPFRFSFDPPSDPAMVSAFVKAYPHLPGYHMWSTWDRLTDVSTFGPVGSEEEDDPDSGWDFSSLNDPGAMRDFMSACDHCLSGCFDDGPDLDDEGYGPSRECFHVDLGDHNEGNHLGMPDNDKQEGGKEEGFPKVHNCFMIYGGQAENASARHRKQERREVCLVKVAAPVYLDWSDKPITFDRGDDPNFVPSLGRYPLVVDPIIGNVRLSKVLMDRGSSLNIIYAETLELLGVDRFEVRPGAAPFHWIAPGKRILPLGRIDLPVCFGTPSNFRKEALTFEVVGFRGTYHAVLGRP
jgi:hypothetical protein